MVKFNVFRSMFLMLICPHDFPKFLPSLTISVVFPPALILKLVNKNKKTPSGWLSLPHPGRTLIISALYKLEGGKGKKKKKKKESAPIVWVIFILPSLSKSCFISMRALSVKLLDFLLLYLIPWASTKPLRPPKAALPRGCCQVASLARLEINKANQKCTKPERPILHLQAFAISSALR